MQAVFGILPGPTLLCVRHTASHHGVGIEDRRALLHVLFSLFTP